MSRLRVLRRSVLLALALGSASASADSESTGSLKGLASFRVIVEKLGSQVERDGGLKREDLQADIEARLATAGIRVSKDAPSVLYTNVEIVCNRQICAFHVDLEVQQRVRLEQRPRVGRLIAPTWRTGVTGLVGRERDLIRQNLRDQVDQFVTAYRAANPAK